MRSIDPVRTCGRLVIGAVLWYICVAVAWAQTAVPVGAPVQIPLHSQAAIVMDAATGRLLFEHNAAEPLPPASVTKIMTLILALEAVDEGRVAMDDLVTTSGRARSMGGSQIWLEEGEQMPFEELLWAIAVGSANDAAVAVAEHLAGSEATFARLMTERARELGAQTAQFSNATGLPPEDVSTDGPHLLSARDVAAISRYAITLPRFLEMVGTWGPVVMRPETQERPVLWTYNKMLRSYPGMDGIKTGMTQQAGYCLAATALRSNVRVIAVSLGAPTLDARTSDMRRLLDYGFSRLKAVAVAEAGEVVATVGVQGGASPEIDLITPEDVYATTLRESQGDPVIDIEYVGPVRAPVAAGEVLANMVVTIEGEEAAVAELVAARAVERGSFVMLWLRQVRRLLGMVSPGSGA